MSEYIYEFVEEETAIYQYELGRPQEDFFGYEHTRYARKKLVCCAISARVKPAKSPVLVNTQDKFKALGPALEVFGGYVDNLIKTREVWIDQLKNLKKAIFSEGYISVVTSE